MAPEEEPLAAGLLPLLPAGAGAADPLAPEAGEPAEEKPPPEQPSRVKGPAKARLGDSPISKASLKNEM